MLVVVGVKFLNTKRTFLLVLVVLLDISLVILNLGLCLKYIIITFIEKPIYGAQIGLGFRNGNLKYEASYSDFGDIDVSSDNNKVTADADSMQFRISYGF